MSEYAKESPDHHWRPLFAAGGLIGIVGLAMLWRFAGETGVILVDVVALLVCVSIPSLLRRVNAAVTWRPDRRAVRCAGAAVAAILVASWLASLVHASTSAAGDNTLADWTSTIQGHHGLRHQLALIAIVVLIAPVLEEIATRGLVLLGGMALLRRLGMNPPIAAAGALLGSSVIFAIGHAQYSLWGQADVLFAGLILGVLVLKTRNLLLSMGVHAVWNAVSVIAMFYTAR